MPTIFAGILLAEGLSCAIRDVSANSMTSRTANTTTPDVRLWSVAMDEIFRAGDTNDEISIERCRELLGDDGVDLCGDEIDRIRRCADTIARVVIEMFLDEKRPTIH
jgi:hypothetical protein